MRLETLRMALAAMPGTRAGSAYKFEPVFRENLKTEWKFPQRDFSLFMRLLSLPREVFHNSTRRKQMILALQDAGLETNLTA